MNHSDIIVIGGGILGLAHAYHASQTGASVTVFERSEHAQGASTRNFGMLAVIAQSEGFQRESAMRSLDTWRYLAAVAQIELRHTGCLFLAHEQEELDVLREYSSSSHITENSAELLSTKQLLDKYPMLESDSLLGGLWCDDAWKVDQRRATGQITDWLQRDCGVNFHFSTDVYAVDNNRVETSKGTFHSSHTVICSGNDFSTLFPDAFAATGVEVCELQMFRYRAQPANWTLDPFVLGGLSLTRYNAFANCRSLPDLVAMQQKKYKEFVDHGIHIIACQESDGSITVGDSHTLVSSAGSEGSGPLNFDQSQHVLRSPRIDQLIHTGLKRMVRLGDASIEEHWCGHYATLPESDVLSFSPAENTQVVTMTNGQGMTHGFAVAEETIGKMT